MAKELITVIIPAYQAEGFIEKAITSVIEQTGDFDMEIIVVNDASTDNTGKVIEKLINTHKNANIIYLNKTINEGVVAARNQAINIAKGKYIAFLDADDWWEESKLQEQLMLLFETESVLCYTARKLVSNEGKELNNKYIEVPNEIDYNKLLKTNVIPCSSVLTYTEAVKEFMFANEELHEDYLLWLRMLKKNGKAVGINKPLLMSRMSIGGKSRDKTKSAKMMIKVYEQLELNPIAKWGYFITYAYYGWKKYR